MMCCCRTGASAGGVRAGRVQRVRVRVRADRHRQDAHDGGHARRRGHHPARLSTHLDAHRERRLRRHHAPRLLFLRRALPRRHQRLALQRLQEAHHQRTGQYICFLLGLRPCYISINRVRVSVSIIYSKLIDVFRLHRSVPARIP